MNDCEQIELRNGPLSFTAWSRGQGPLVLLIHGFPDLPQTWASQLHTLAAAGYRAVAVTSRGYERSSQPADNNYQATALATDVEAWLDSLGAEQAHLVGHDWGAAISYSAAASQPERFTSLTALSLPHTGRLQEVMPSSLRQLWLSRYIFLFQLAGVAEKKLSKQQFAYVDTLWQRWSGIGHTSCILA